MKKKESECWKCGLYTLETEPSSLQNFAQDWQIPL